jgi:hypothetical protein
MKRARLSGSVVLVLLLAVSAGAGTITVNHKLDYLDNYNKWLQPDSDPDRIVFAPPWADIDDINNTDVIDHLPYYRNHGQSWGWVHDVTSRTPSDATGIVSAVLTIDAWDVNGERTGPDNTTIPAETDEIYVNDIWVGNLNSTPTYGWGDEPTTFTLPATLLDDLWEDSTLYVYMEIDSIDDVYGDRVTLGSSTLTVTYEVSGQGRDDVRPLFRFWSSVQGRHYFTTSESDRDYIIHTLPETWDYYEGIGYYLPTNEAYPNVMPVYRFWSSMLSSYFYTIDPDERDFILETYLSHVWALDGVAFYAYPEGQQPANAKPVYRFWSDILGTHFYTISEDEKDYILATWPYAWTYESIAYYAYDN